ncbi:succinyl-CoA synthetase subunit alpha [Pigmentiphaga humi]|uniref:Succinyl-CoA synthetase subunit alpha n=1 Tax=Pigmentiphaga humi TaxID=2478468 RepID=A0A3P4AVN3_9BURK|nr:acetate--CoA ligase family protein [Pigmentiphaga humi]VCU68073.1 succinyl-CoA synthetase subunit alpha [Pigmentiphaga humi]
MPGNTDSPDRLAAAHALDPLFAPASVAVLGASGDPLKIGGRPIKFLKSHGYAGTIHPVNPKGGEIQGLPALRSVGELPRGVDHAIVALPASAVLDAAAACAERGVRAMTIFSAGFAETGPEGAAMQARLSALARDSGMRIIGPNCMGVMNFRIGMIASFAFMVDLGLPRLGRTALVSQSGAFGGQALVMANRRGLPLGAWVTTGNECDVEMADCIAYFAGDDQTDVIMGYMEGCRSPGKLVAALALARERGKRVVMVKAGSSDVGKAAAQSHTGALAGNDRVYDSLFRQYGVYRADSIESFFDAAYAAGSGKRMPQGKVGVFTVSGGVGVLMADVAERQGLELAPLPQPAQDTLRALLPLAAVRNPVDGTAQIWSDMALFRRFVRTMLSEGRYEAVVFFLTAMPYSPPLQQPIIDIFTELRQEFPDLALVLSMLAPPALQDTLAERGYLVIDDASRAIEALAALHVLSQPSAGPVDRTKLPRLAHMAELTTGNEHAAKQALAQAGIPMLPERAVADPDEACRAARELGYPVVLKALSADIVHKSELGAVELGIADEAGLRAAWDAIAGRVAQAAPQARLDGMLLAPMAPPGVEMILGVQRDPVFGPVVMVGMGGIYAELLDDVALRIAPVDHDAARAMVRELKAFPLLDGARGRPRADLEALADAIVRLSVFAGVHADRLESIDINPLRVFEAGKGAAALDAVLLARAAREEETA